MKPGGGVTATLPACKTLSPPTLSPANIGRYIYLSPYPLPFSFSHGTTNMLYRARIFKLLRTPDIDSMESIPYNLSPLSVVMEQ